MVHDTTYKKSIHDIGITGLELATMMQYKMFSGMMINVVVPVSGGCYCVLV